MKDKLVRTPFSQDAFEDGVKERWEGYQGELQRTSDKKLELFIQVNYFHSCLDDSMEYLLKTDQARGMHPKKVVRILFERGAIEDKDAKDAMKINQIKNFFAHDDHNPNIQSDAEKIINKMEIEMPIIPPMSDSPHLADNEQMREQLSKWNMHQKLDWIIHGLVVNMKNKVLRTD
jgi:hypothetical protein